MAQLHSVWYRYVTMSCTFVSFQLWAFKVVLLNFKDCFSNGSLPQGFQSFFVLAESICLDAETSIIKVPADKNRHHLSPLRLSKVDMVLGIIQMQICKTQKSWENQLNQHLQLWLPRPRNLSLCDPWLKQLKMLQTGEVVGRCPMP